ncbi:open rectifier potassium channel protein 1-like [Amphibalanus amphitrite]|uniref:open rectifier potassium channel protein 1-like n=1 Tax=Amphibalanus amphitrite TaxID=1232801 RepID=UPI001C9281D6|nr:open rectifier potassium channel protein 1-like [Amphibalanus amphitrite]
MKLHEWGLLLLAYVLLLLIGAASFYFLERGHEEAQRQRLLQLRSEVHSELISGANESTVTRRQALLRRISDQCGADISDTGRPPAVVWNEYNSFFFCFTVVTTIGFGHIAPSTTLGRVVCILYALVGIPFNGILLKNISDLFSNKVIRARQRIKSRRYQTRLEVLVDTLFYLFPAVLLFFLLPAGIFIMLEDWDFVQALYFSFITLTTIGFGDLVPGKAGGSDYESAWLWLYKIGLVVWIVFGLGYLLMILEFISRALYSKKILSLEKKLVKGISRTKQTFQKNISKEVVLFKKLLNELAMDRRVNAVPPRGVARTQSFPNLAAGGGDAPEDVAAEPPAPLRRTGSLSEVPLGEGGGAGDSAPLAAAPLSAGSATDLAAVLAAVVEQRPEPGPDAEPAPASQVPSVDSALELLLQAKVTLEWDVSSEGSGQVVCDDAADGGGVAEDVDDGGGGEEAQWSPDPPAAGDGEPSADAGFLRRLQHAWQNRPSLLPGVWPERAPRGPPPSRRRRRATTSVADLLRLMRVAAAARHSPRRPAGAAPTRRPRRRRTTAHSPAVVTFQTENTRL